MSAIRIERPHALGMARARALSKRWMDEAAQRFDLQCTRATSPGGDTIEFLRPGVQGRFEVTADRFVIEAELGWALGVFRARVEHEIVAQLDALLAAETAKGAGSATAKTAAGAPAKTARKKPRGRAS